MGKSPGGVACRPSSSDSRMFDQHACPRLALLKRSPSRPDDGTDAVHRRLWFDDLRACSFAAPSCAHVAPPPTGLFVRWIGFCFRARMLESAVFGEAAEDSSSGIRSRARFQRFHGAVPSLKPGAGTLALSVGEGRYRTRHLRFNWLPPC